MAGSPAVATQPRENLRARYCLHVTCFELVISALGFVEPELSHQFGSQFIKTRDQEMREPYPFTGFKAKDFTLKFVAGHRSLHRNDSARPRQVAANAE